MINGRGGLPAAKQAALFHAAADEQNDPLDHDMLHAAGRILEVLPRYRHPSEAEYIARWLDALWARFVAVLVVNQLQE